MTATTEYMHSPAEIEEIAGAAYQDYLSDLHRLWLAARHPDVDDQGRPRRRDLSETERGLLMQERIGSFAGRMPAGRWHKDSFSPRSSQALLVEVLGALSASGALDIIGLETDDSATFDVALEEHRGKTNFDAVIRGGSHVVATVEAKFTEKGFNCCTYPVGGRCDGSWWARPGHARGCPMAAAPANRAVADRYWNAAIQVLGIPETPPPSPVVCPLRAGYQIAHNIAETRTLSSRAAWILLYDERNPFFSHPAVGWANVCSFDRAGANAVSWQRIFAAAATRVPQLDRLRGLHGF
jgi:hypothetical protein